MSSLFQPIQWITKLVFLIRIHWIVIYRVDSTIQCLNNQGLDYSSSIFTVTLNLLDKSVPNNKNIGLINMTKGID